MYLLVLEVGLPSKARNAALTNVLSLILFYYLI